MAEPNTIQSVDLTTPITIPVGPAQTPETARLVSQQRKMEDVFWGQWFYENPARRLQEIQPQQRASINNAYLPSYISASYLYDLEDEMVDKDEVIGGTEDTVASQVLAREQRIEAPKGFDDDAAKPYVEFVERALFGMPGGEWTAALKCLLLGARRHGFAVAEVAWDVKGGRYVPGGIAHRHPGMFDFRQDGVLLYNTGTAQQIAMEGELRWHFIVHRNVGFYNNPYGQSEIFPLRWPYFFKKNAKKAWIDGIETYGLPILAAIIGNTVSERDARKAELEAMMQTIRADAGVVLTEGITLEGIDRGASKGGALPHQALIEYLDRAMVRRLTGSTLSTMENGGTGSLAQSKVHGQIANERLVAVCSALQETINRDLITPLIEINFGKGAPVPRLVIDVDDDADVQNSLAIFKAASELGVPTSADQFRDWNGLVAPKNEADTIQPRDPQATAPGPLALPFSEPHTNGCRCGCGTGSPKSFFFDERTDELNRVYDEYHRTVNMTASQLERWAANECSREASLDRAPIERNLELLRTPKADWTAKHVEWAKRTISFVARMRGNSSGEPASANCDMSKRAISLLNWAYNPGVKFSEGADGPRYLTFASGGRRSIEAAYARQIAAIAETVRTANKATLSRELRDAARQLRELGGPDANVTPSLASRVDLKLAPLPRDTEEAVASARLLAARQIAERLGSGRAGVGRGRKLTPADLAAPYRDGIDWMVNREIITRDSANAIANSASLIRGSTDTEETARIIRQEALALAKAPNVEMAAVFQRNLAAAANQGMGVTEYLEAMDEATKDNNLPPFADAYTQNVYRTETANIYQGQRLATMADPAVADSIWGVELFSMSDERTRQTHAATDGVLLRKGSGAYNAWLPGPPYSYQCRCTSAPVLIGEEAEETPGALSIVRAIERF